MAIKQSFTWWSFQGRGVESLELLKGAAKIGFSAVELIDPDKFEMACDLGLAIAAHNGHGSLTDGFNNPNLHGSLEKEVLGNIELAVKHQIPNLIVFSGNRQVGVSDYSGAEFTAQGLARLAPIAEEAGVTLILELFNSKVDHPGYQADHVNWGVQVCELVGSPNVKILYDIYHMQIMEGDIIRTIRHNSQHFRHYHTAGCPGRNDLDVEQELQYAPIINAIQTTGYPGYIAHEFFPKGNPLAALQAAYDLCNDA
jgi:hydroxypyruvate isomerase